MGDGTGLDFARWSREQGKKFHIVFLSAYRKFEYAQEAMAYGVRSYIVKPPSADHIVSVFNGIRKEIEAENAADGETDSIVDLVRTYVEGNYSNAKIEKAAQLARMNSHYLSTYFKEKSGQTFSDFLLATRMRQAGKMLLEGRHRTNEISEKIGYSDPKNFVRAFRRFYGTSPREYKKGGSAQPATRDYSTPKDAPSGSAASGASTSGHDRVMRVPAPASDHISH
jgi:YesN/AraC family two-component response regulator